MGGLRRGLCHPALQLKELEGRLEQASLWPPGSLLGPQGPSLHPREHSAPNPPAKRRCERGFLKPRCGFVPGLGTMQGSYSPSGDIWGVSYQCASKGTGAVHVRGTQKTREDEISDPPHNSQVIWSGPSPQAPGGLVPSALAFTQGALGAPCVPPDSLQNKDSSCL